MKVKAKTEELVKEEPKILYYQKTIEETTTELATSTKEGLSTREAQSRLIANGKNELDKGKKRSIIMKFLDQLNNFMIFVLLGAAVISLVINIIEIKTSGASLDVDPFLILGIVILNSIIGVIQEAKADKALESIKKLSSPQVKVIRDGIQIVIDAKDIVVGDLVVLDAGDYVPADLRLIESVSLKIDEGALTGESVAVDKNLHLLSNVVPLGDRLNSAYMSTVVTYGRGKGIAVATGMNTEIGHIAKLLSNQEQEITPLQKSINGLGKILAIICLAIVVFIAIIQIITTLISHSELMGEPDTYVDIFMTAVALAVAAIPEGLPAIITIVLALGMQNLVKQKAIMKTLPAVETLGSTSIICSDKTGTLTQNIMDVLKVYDNGEIIDINKNTNLSASLDKLILYGVLNNDTKTNFTDNKFVKIGDPTEIAFIDLALKFNQDPMVIAESYPRIHEFPFDSDRKMMTTFHQIDGKTISITKGAPDVIFSKSISEIKNGRVINLESTTDYEHANTTMTDTALRVLAIAIKEYANDTDFSQLTMKEVEKDLTLVGLIGMMDPARPEAKEAIKVCRKAGITTIMITGDHKNTAIAIARELKILSKGNLAITGAELDLMEDAEFREKLPNIRVYARVSPENKVRIVTAWKETGLIVAMTGDGVNDAPSIKKADIGIAMGITGTEVAKGAADMILTDDNFATIVNAVGEGRTIFANIKKAIHYLLSCNIGEILVVLLGSTIAFILLKETVVTLTAIQLLWVNIVTDSLMAIALGLEKKEKNVMDSAPRDVKKNLFSGSYAINIIVQGVILGIICFAAYMLGYYLGKKHNLGDTILAQREGQTLCFMVLAISQLFHAWNARSSEESIFKLKMNWWLFGAFFICLALQMMTLLPGISNVFDLTTSLEWYEPVIIVGLCLVLVFVVEIQKIFLRRQRKARNKYQEEQENQTL
ncbi:MAG: cation-translocating P-type ATPase [Acholeplasmatales bacterium]|jgi:Ca2+-transporting ATPase|nr:cation-translocating P-type ATPase [Acholeplasmatales bacterium]